jgi:hypothetical protein
VFAISVSAATVTDEIKHKYFPMEYETESIEGIVAENHIHADILENYPDSVNARVRFKCGCAKGYHIYPTYYITDVNQATNLKFDYSDINSKNPCKAKYNKNNMLALEFPNGYTYFDGDESNTSYGVRKSTTLQYVDMSTSKTLTTLSMGTKAEPFCDCAALKYVKMSSATTRIPAWSFIRCYELLIVDIPVDSRIEHIGTQAFKYCPKLSALYLPDSLKTIGFLNDGSTLRNSDKNSDAGSEGDRKGTFYSCTELFFVNNPEDTEKPTVYYMPKSLEKTSGEIFKNLDKINDVIVFGENFYCFNGGAGFAQIDKKTTFVFKGEFANDGAKIEYSCEIANVEIYLTNKNVQYKNLIKYTTSWNGATPSKSYLYVCSEGLKAELKKQKDKVADAVLDFTEENFAHFVENENVGVHYDNYFAKGYVLNECYCKEKMIASEATLEPVFSSRGISAPEDPSRGACVTQGIKVNREMLNLLGNDVDFGIVVDVNVNGEAYNPILANATTVSLIDSEYDCFDVKVSGIPNDYLSTAIVFCFYIKENKRLSYLDLASTLESVTGMSYNAALQLG